MGTAPRGALEPGKIDLGRACLTSLSGRLRPLSHVPSGPPRLPSLAVSISSMKKGRRTTVSLTSFASRARLARVDLTSEELQPVIGEFLRLLDERGIEVHEHHSYGENRLTVRFHDKLNIYMTS